MGREDYTIFRNWVNAGKENGKRMPLRGKHFTSKLGIQEVQFLAHSATNSQYCFHSQCWWFDSQHHSLTYFHFLRLVGSSGSCIQHKSDCRWFSFWRFRELHLVVLGLMTSRQWSRAAQWFFNEFRMNFKKDLLAKFVLLPSPCKTQTCECMCRHTKSNVFLPYKINKT